MNESDKSKKRLGYVGILIIISLLALGIFFIYSGAKGNGFWHIFIGISLVLIGIIFLVARRVLVRDTTKEDPHQVEVLSYLREKLLPIDFVEESSSEPLVDKTTFSRYKFTVSFGYDYKDLGYFFNTSHGKNNPGSNYPVSDVTLVVDLDLKNKANNLKKIEAFIVDVHANLDKGLAEVGLTSG